VRKEVGVDVDIIPAEANDREAHAFGAASLTADFKRGWCDCQSWGGKVDVKPNAGADDLGGEAMIGIQLFLK